MPGEHPVVTCRTFLDGPALKLGHMVWKPLSGAVDVPGPRENVLVLPLRGAFARHGPQREECLATASDGVFFPSGRDYRLSHPGRVGDEVLVLSWPHAAFDRVAEGAAMPESQVLLGPAQLLARSVVWSRCARGDLDPLELESLAQALLVSALEASGARRTPRRLRGGVRRRVHRVRDAVASAPERSWSLAELAGLAHVSPGQLTRIFREEVGMPVHAYVVRARLGKALDAVLQTDESLVDVAIANGFSSHSHFTSRFRREFGIAPAALRASRSRAPVQLDHFVTARLAA